MSHIDEKLFDELQEAAGRAIRLVMSGERKRATCALTVTVAVEKKTGAVRSTANVNDGTKREQVWYPSGGQMAMKELAEAIEQNESVTFSSPGREPVTIRGKG